MAVFVNTENENPDAHIAVAAQFVIMESKRTDVLNARISFALLRGAPNMVANFLAHGL